MTLPNHWATLYVCYRPMGEETPQFTLVVRHPHLPDECECDFVTTLPMTVMLRKKYSQKGSDIGADRTSASSGPAPAAAAHPVPVDGQPAEREQIRLFKALSTVGEPLTPIVKTTMPVISSGPFLAKQVDERDMMPPPATPPPPKRSKVAESGQKPTKPRQEQPTAV